MSTNHGWGPKRCFRCSQFGHSSHECKFPILPPEPIKETPEEPPEDKEEPEYFMYGIGC